MHPLTSALDGGEHNFTPRPLYPQGRAPGTHWRRGWVDPRAVLDVMVKRKIPSPHTQFMFLYFSILSLKNKGVHPI